MSKNADGERSQRDQLIDAWNDARRSFREFLLIPTLMVSGFLLLAMLLNYLDGAEIAWVESIRDALKEKLFVESGATSDFLATVAAGIISITSITISLLLIAVQQGAGSLTSSVFDQFLRRRRNQAYFGYFIGLALYCLVTFSTVNESSNAVLGATLAFLFTIIALYILIILLYSTINQMRPAIIIAAIHDRTLDARHNQLWLLHRTRRTAQLTEAPHADVLSKRNGFITGIKLDQLEKKIANLDEPFEITLQVSVGIYVAWHDHLAQIRGGTAESRKLIADAIVEAIEIERLRDIEIDPAFGLSQLERIGWTTISSAKSSPGSGAHAIRSLRDLLSRWANENIDDPTVKKLPIVYTDNVFEILIDTLESLAIASVESMQHQNFTQVMRAFISPAKRLSAVQLQAVVALIERLIPYVGEHIATKDMGEVLQAVATSLIACQQHEAASRIKMVEDKLGRRVIDL